jgi:hypothetical protein
MALISSAPVSLAPVRCPHDAQLLCQRANAGVKVYAGSQNFGIYVRLPERSDEEYRITHPTANITGFLRGSPYVTISDFSSVTCLAPEGVTAPGTKALRTIIAFTDEVRSLLSRSIWLMVMAQSWIGKARFALEGIVYEYEIGTEAADYTKTKQVPEPAIRAYIEGSWRGKITFKTTKTGKVRT